MRKPGTGTGIEIQSSPSTVRGGINSRKLGLFGAIALLAGASLLFYGRQNSDRQVGGRMSPPKLLWLSYTLAAWFMMPFYFWRSPCVTQPIRRIYGAHLLNFAGRAVVELWMLYVTCSWVPPYGIGHDIFSLALIFKMRGIMRKQARHWQDPIYPHAERFIHSIQAGLCCEIVFARLFYRAIGGEPKIYFASVHPKFSWINRMTWAVVLPAYCDLAYTIWDAREALFPLVERKHAG